SCDAIFNLNSGPGRGGYSQSAKLCLCGISGLVFQHINRRGLCNAVFVSGSNSPFTALIDSKCGTDSGCLTVYGLVAFGSLYTSAIWGGNLNISPIRGKVKSNIVRAASL